MSALPLRPVFGQPSWTLRSSHVEAHLTQLGGQLAPVKFRLGSRTVTPFSVAPWAEEPEAKSLVPLLRALRGDFFCAPFGGNGTAWKGEQHPPHGETANARWRAAGIEHEGDRTTLHASLRTRVRAGRVDKYLTLIEGHTAVYQRHVLSGASGPMCVGHHAMLKFPPAHGSGNVSTSRFVHGQVLPTPFELPEAKGYQALQPGAKFHSLDSVPLWTGGEASLASYPARTGFEDLVMLTADPKLPFGWTTVTFPGERYAWFALRDPRVLRHTILWLSNGGRHYPPWNGRHVGVLGLEDTTSYFHYGLAESAESNPLNSRGIPTTLTLDPERPTTISYLLGVAAVPRGFERVADIVPTKAGVELVGTNGERVRVKLDLGFIEGS